MTARSKRCRRLRPCDIDPQMRRDAGAVLARPQRAQIVRQRLGQHRHDAVGEIDRVAAPRRLAVERAAGRDIGRDIGDRDDDVPAARVGRVRIGLGPDRVVEIARVLAVDRDQREVAQIGAAVSARIAGVRGPAASASARAAAGNSAGMSNAAIVSRLIASGASAGPSRSRMRACLPKRRDGISSATTSSPSGSPAASCARRGIRSCRGGPPPR